MYTRQTRIFVGFGNEVVHHLGQFCRATLATILNVKLKATCIAQTEDWRWGKGQHQTFLNAGRAAKQFTHQLPGYSFALIPVALGHEHGGRVVLETAAQKVEPSECHGILVGRVGGHCIHHFRHNFVSALQGGAIGQKHRSNKVALVFIRHQ